ncbi:MAG TPA: hypothetical protein VMI54_19260 [Polyangiaceae bacterium]|nr:hypothetical protein [Polyangiaceae bacterium]
MTERPTTPRDKALQINLAGGRHGIFAEIGAGQEVGRWFFRVGGAAATVAKTVSAYDMTFSDASYGPTHRYVSRERLLAMLDREYALLLERLDATRGATTAFFAFANTVAARSHSRPDHAHGWMGVRFQGEPRSAPSQIVLHVKLWDADNGEQQEALGAAGVNLVHAAFYLHASPAELLTALLDELSADRVEIDMIEFSGPLFANLDNRLMALLLVEQGLTEAAMFRVNGEVIDPADALYKRPVLVERGRFRPVNRLHLAILEQAGARFRSELPAGAAEPLTLFELTLRDLERKEHDDHADFLARVDALATLSGAVLVSRFSEYFALAAYLAELTDQNIALAAGVPAVRRIFDEQYYTDLRGGILEACGRLFSKRVRLYAYPTRTGPHAKILSCDDLELPAELGGLFTYLRANGFIQPIPAAEHSYFEIRSSDVLALIRAGDPSWESLVPAPVASVIKQHGYFGCPKV